MDTNESSQTPEQAEELKQAALRFSDTLVDAFEDALADVHYSLNVKYDRPQLIEAMQLAIKINDMLDYVQLYIDQKPVDGE